jgi:hypothetical protein
MSNKPFVNAPNVNKTGLKSRNSGKAIASFVLGLSSFFCAVFTGLIAVILGALALGDISKSRGRLQGNGFAIAGIVLGGLGCFWTLIWIALLLPAVQQAREATRQISSKNNLKQLDFALLNYQTVHRFFPPITGGDGLSWRVHILPFLEEQELYGQFHLDEPWDSPHNLSLVNRMPDVFKNPNHQLPPGKTVYLIPTTPKTANPNAPHAALIQGQRGSTLSDFRDGLSNTILLLEADPDAAAIWTDPNGDWMYDPANPLRSLGHARPRVILVGFADGVVQAINNKLSPPDMNGLITRDGGDTANY